MKLIVNVKRLNKRNRIPQSFAEKDSIVGTVVKGYTFEGTENTTPIAATLGKWYRDSDGFFYWGGGLIVAEGKAPRPVAIGGLPANLPAGYLLGADISHHNGNLDWDALSKAGISFVYIKISEGVNTPDKMAKVHAANAQRLGIKIGYYHFCRPDTRNGGTIESDARAEAQEALNIMAALPPAALPLALDLEDVASPRWDTPLGRADYQTWIETFIGHITQQGIRCLLYSRKEYLDRKLPAVHTLGAHSLWIAIYSIADCKRVVCPMGWDKWAIWQFTEEGKTAGNAKIDLNILQDTSLIT